MKRKSISIATMGFVAVCAVSIGIGIKVSADSKTGWSPSSLGEEYIYNEKFYVEERSYTKDGKEFRADAVVCFPDGSRTSEKEFVLDQAGKYTVKYTVKTENKVFAESESFLVQYPAYYVSDGKSSVSFGTPERAETSGVQVSLAANDALVFTQYIDFTKITADDYLIQGYVTPDVAGSADFSELVFTFTDSVDPSVFFQVHHYGYDWCYNTYVAANGNNQAPAGMHQNQGLHSDDGSGLWSYVSFSSRGQTGIVAPDETQFFVAMDYAEKKLYGVGFPGMKNMYCDLDDTEYFKDVWTGFPSGKARLSVNAYGYMGAAAKLCITEVFGIEDLSKNIYIDETAPVISVNDEYDGNMPYGLVGYDYEIPSASAYDEYAGDCEVCVSVLYNYGMENSVNVPVKDDKFKVDKAGTYAIVYDVCDALGNRSREVRVVTAYAEAEDASFEIPTERVTAAEIGSWIDVPEISGDEVIGGSGKKTIAVYAEIDGVREEISDGFRALKLGTYKVIYAATDYVGKTTEKFYEVTVTVGDSSVKPVLETDYDIYPAYISGATYSLPSYYAYYYEDGALKRSLCEVTITDADGANTYTAGDKASVVVENNYDKVLFEIKSRGVTLATHEAVGVLAWVREDGGLRLHSENYFYGEGFDKEKTSDGIVLTTKQGEDFSVTFANALSADGMSLKLTDFVGAKEGTLIRITVSDASNRKRFVSAVLRKDVNGVVFEVGDKKQEIVGLSFNNTDSFEIVYAKGSFTIGNYTLEVSGFEGFESRKAFLSVSFENIDAGSGYTFSELGNTRFNTAQTDRYSPVLIAGNETGGTWDVGSIYTLYATLAYDVYSPNIVYTLTVTDSDGNAVSDVNGVLLDGADPTKDYRIKLDKIGQYLVTYTAYEEESFLKKSNSVSLVYTINVPDKIKPSIEWNGTLTSEAKVGDTIIVPAYTVSDNYSEADKIIVRVFVETPANQLLMLPGNSIVVHHAGIYRFRIMVVDEAGNITSETYRVNVTEDN